MLEAAPVAVKAPEAAEAAAVLAAGSKTFHFASLFLPRACRADAALLYALCRYIDDVADEADDPDQARTALEALSAELRGDRPPRPFIATVLEMFERCDIDVRAALDLVRGVEEDLSEVRLADDAALVRYGYLVAGTVGLMMCGVLGVRAREALPHAIDLGVAMQITNICRDVAEDARLGRVYLPATRLRAVGVDPTPEGVLEGAEGVQRVVYDLLAMAERYYRSAEEGMAFIPFRARLAILVAARVYRAIGQKLLRDGGDPLRGRTVVPLGEKLVRAIVAILAFPNVSQGRAKHRASLHMPLIGFTGANPTAKGH